MAVSRRGLSLFLLFIGVIMIQKIYRWDGHYFVTQLTQQDCTDDPVLTQVFLNMETYLSNAQSGARRFFLYLFGSIVIAFNIGGLLNMKNRMIGLGFEADDRKKPNE